MILNTYSHVQCLYPCHDFIIHGRIHNMRTIRLIKQGCVLVYLYPFASQRHNCKFSNTFTKFPAWNEVWKIHGSEEDSVCV